MGLFSRRSSAGAKAPPKTSPAVAQRIRETLHIRDLESMPALAARAFQLASDPSASIEQFVTIIEADEVLSARILRVANSVYFQRGAAVTDIEAAVGNIGLNELRALISASMLRSLLRGSDPLRQQVWENSVGTAIGARMIAAQSGASEGEAFLAGLLHDVGKLVMLRHVGPEYSTVIDRLARDQPTFAEAELAVFGVNHIEVGKWAAEAWGFPPAIVAAIAAHHDEWPKGAARPSLAMLVRCADLLAHAAGVGLGPSLRSFQRRATEELPSGCAAIGVADCTKLLADFDSRYRDEAQLYELERGGR